MSGLKRSWRRLAAAARRHRWSLLGLLALVWLALGMWGYAQLYPWLPLGDRLYISLALFRDSTALYKGVIAPLPAQLEVARWFAPLTLAFAGLSAVLALFSEQLTRLRIRCFYRRHLVICGLGTFGLRLASAFRAQDHRVVVVDRSPAALALSRCRELSIPVLIADATDADVLGRAGLQRARHLVAVCGDNSINAEVGVLARKRFGHGRRRLSCYVHVDDDELCQLLEQSSLNSADETGSSISFVNVFRSGRVALLRAYPGAFADRDGRPPHVLVVGTDTLALPLIAGVVREWWFDHREDLLRLQLSLVAPDAGERVRTLSRRYPHLEDVCDLVAHDVDVADPALPALPSLERKDNWEGTTVFVSYRDERASLEATMRLANELPRHVSIVVLTTGQAAPVTLLDTLASDLRYPNVSTFPLIDRVCQPDVFVHSSTEQIAQALHENYLANRKRDGTYDPARPSHRRWSELPQTYREANHEQSVGHCQRLARVGYAIEPTEQWDVEAPAFSDDEVEKMAEMEHSRWGIERRADGWVAGPVRDDSKKRHPDLVPWADLNDLTKQKDREAVRELPAVLARYGLAVVKRR